MNKNPIEDIMKTLKEDWPKESLLKSVVIKKRYGPSEVKVYATGQDLLKYKNTLKFFAYQNEIIMIEELSKSFKVYDDTDQLLIEKSYKEA